MRVAREFPKKLLLRKVRSSLALRGMTQRDLATQLGMSTATLSRIVTGVRRARAIEREKIAGALGYAVARLLRHNSKRQRKSDDAK